MNKFSENEMTQISISVKRLFMLQGKAYNNERGIFFINEICKMNAPIEAILHGINDLTDHDMKDIRIKDITIAINKRRKTSASIVHCQFCDGVGIISMIDSHKRSFAFACVCKAGNNYFFKDDKKYIYHRWNKEETQQINGGTYTLHDKGISKHPQNAHSEARIARV